MCVCVVFILELGQLTVALSDARSLGNRKEDVFVRSYLKQPWLLQLISQHLEKFRELAEVQHYAFKILYSVCTVTKLEVRAS